MSVPSDIRDPPKVFRLSVRINPDHGGQVRAQVQDVDNLGDLGALVVATSGDLQACRLSLRDV